MNIEKAIDMVETKPYRPKSRYIKQFVKALEKVCDETADVDMSSTEEGSFGTPGCHAALVRELFMGLPDAWYEEPTWACENGHISRHYIKSERLGHDAMASVGKRLRLSILNTGWLLVAHNSHLYCI